MTIATRGQEQSPETTEPNQSGSTTALVTTAQDELPATEDTAEPLFPQDKLAALDEKISSIRWVVPVLPDQELECLLRAAIDLCRTGADIRSEPCQRFFREGLTISFTKILTDDAVPGWKPNIHLCINQNCLRLVEVCVLKLGHDWFPLLDLLAMVLNPNCKFHTFNATRQSESTVSNPTVDLYARCGDLRNVRGWLVDLINRFGDLGGFTALLDRFQSGSNLTVSVVYSLLRPFGLCYEYLTPSTINKYLLPILELVPSILGKLTDDELKREAKNETKSDIVSAIIKSSKNLASRVSNQDELIRVLEGFRLKMILRQLQISSFNGKMNALNEINKVISSVSYYPNRHHSVDDEEYLTPEKMACWINENKVLEIVLRDSLHQPQYVEKLEKILRFVIKERALSISDLDAVWSAQVGKHEAIVKNVHDLLAKLAWDFSPDQLDHLFECFQTSWTSASRRQRERLLELIRRLAEDDKDGDMAYKVLTLFWNLAHSEDAPTEMLDQALTAHIKILDYSCSQERDAQKTVWIDKCVGEIKISDKWVIPALKQIREICLLYEPTPNGGVHPQRGHHLMYRQEVIERLQSEHSFVVLVTNNLTTYMDKLRTFIRSTGEHVSGESYVPDGRYPHVYQVQERLNFLRFLLKDGQLWLCAEQAKQIWQCLAENAVFASDREACFKWFAKLMGEEPDLDPGINKEFFENNILMIDQLLLTESGIKCFERFFKAVNTKEGKLKEKRRCLLTEDPDLIGLDYLWKVVTLCPDDIASRAIELLREVSTNLGPRLAGSQVEFHETYITECFDRLRAHFDTIIALQRNTTIIPQPPATVNTSSSSSSLGSVSSVSSTFSSSERDFSAEQIQVRIRLEAVKLCRVLHVLHEHISECDSNYAGAAERRILPLHRACRGKHMSLIVRFTNANNRQVDDIEIYTHSNDTLASLRKSVLRKIKSSEHYKVELFVAGETLEFANDHKLLSQLPIRDKMIISAKVSQVNVNMASSQDSSSDSSTSSPQHPYECPTTSAGTSGPDPLCSISTQQAPTSIVNTGNTGTTPNTSNSSSSSSNNTAENFLPGVIMSKQPAYAAFFCQLSALGSRLQYTALRDGARSLLQLMPSDTATIERLLLLFHHHPAGAGGGGGGRVIGTAPRVGPGGGELTVESMFFGATPAEVLYNLEVLYALLMPAIDPFSDKSYRIQYNFLVSGEAHTFLEMFTKNNFMCGADTPTARSAYLVVLKVCKLIVTAVAHVLVRLAEDHTQVLDGMVGGQVTSPGGTGGLSMGADATPGMLLKQALRFVPCPSDQIVRQVSMKLSQALADLITSTPPPPPINPTQVPPPSSTLFHLALNWDLPDLNTIRALVRLIWAASSANLRTALNLSADQLHSLCDPTKRNAQLELHRDDVMLCKEALEVLSVALVLNPEALEELCRKGGGGLVCAGAVEKGSNINFHMFVTDMVLLNPNRSVRIAAGEQFILICTYGAASRTALQLIAPLLFSLLDNLVLENARTSHEFFQLLCRLVNASFLTSHPLPATQQLLTNEITWLRSARGQHDTLLEGHLCLTRELLCFMSPEQKCELGSADCGSLIKELVEDFLFPASKLALQLQRSGKLGEDPGIPICESPQTQAAAFEVLLVLCGNCVENCRQLVGMLNEMFYTDPETAILEWDYLPAIGPRPQQGFVGLKNAGATCYMNSVLQQLYMVASIREGILACEGAATDPREDFSGEERSNISHIIDFNRDRESREARNRDRDVLLRDNSRDVDEPDADEKEDKEKKIASDYNVGILKQVQAIFGHLACSRLQYYVPRGLWRHFKLQGEPVNLREQQDAVEFFMALVESLDEALKLLGLEQIMSKILGGSYSDQKICKGCPHRYSKEEPFSVISVDIRNHSSLQDSMEQYVKGELLEGADAYHCDKCQQKVVTVKRLCVKKLPPVLAIQLKRFEYDFERVCAIKFNDYFEFPRHLDMEPYTVSGLAKVEGEVIDVDVDANVKETCTRYELTGIVVHSGQASGGHYYSYIRSRDPATFPTHSNVTASSTTTTTMPDNNTTTIHPTANVSSGNLVPPTAVSGSSGAGSGGGDSSHWYKFDDGEVSACAMSDDDEIKMQCFGGDYMAEVFDPVIKRTSYRRQKRWWNAYMLFYTRLDVEEADVVNRLSEMKFSERKEPLLRMPPAIEHSIRKQNIKFLHHRNQFNIECFNFIRKLVTTTSSNSSGGNGNGPTGQRNNGSGSCITAIEAEQLNVLSTQLAARFLFHTGWHTKKTLRGPAMEWCDLLCVQLRSSAATRGWFAMHILFAAPHRFVEYLLACPTNEVRIAFVKIVVLLAHFSIGDPTPPGLRQLQQQHASSSNNQTQLGLSSLEHASLSDHILAALLRLLQGEAVAGEHGGRHLAHYCNVFHMYANQGIQEKEQLLKLNVPATFMQVALDEGPVPVIKYQYAELAKLNQVVTCLVRCCDVSSKCQSSTAGPILPNPHREPSCQSSYIMPLSAQVYDTLYSRSNYIKKVIEESSNAPEDAMKLLQYCSWENPHFSRTVLSELLWQISFAFCNELRHHMDLLLSVLLLEDSWQTHRIHNAVQGVPDERDGLLETIAKSRDHYQKRGYQCLKCLVNLFMRSRTAKQMLLEHVDVKRKYQQAVSWLEEELDRKYPNSSQYPYNSWSPPAQSNEISNGYVLERSNSARKTLERALEILPELKQPPPQQQQRPTTPIMDFFEDEDGQQDDKQQQQQQQQQQPDVAEITTTTSPVKKSTSSQSLDLEPTRDVAAPITAVGATTTNAVSPISTATDSTEKLDDDQVPQTTEISDNIADLDT